MTLQMRLNRIIIDLKELRDDYGGQSSEFLENLIIELESLYLWEPMQ